MTAYNVFVKAEYIASNYECRDGTPLLIKKIKGRISGALMMTEYARYLGINYGTLKRWHHEGMPAIPRNRHVFVFPEITDEWVRAHHANSVSFDRESFIYFVRREDRAIKIGWSSDVLRRLVELRRDNGNVVLLACVPGIRADETALHLRFAGCHVGGEWFSGAAVETYVDSFRHVLRTV